MSFVKPLKFILSPPSMPPIDLAVLRQKVVVSFFKPPNKNLFFIFLLTFFFSHPLSSFSPLVPVVPVGYAVF